MTRFRFRSIASRTTAAAVAVAGVLATSAAVPAAAHHRPGHAEGPRPSPSPTASPSPSSQPVEDVVDISIHMGSSVSPPTASCTVTVPHQSRIGVALAAAQESGCIDSYELDDTSEPYYGIRCINSVCRTPQATLAPGVDWRVRLSTYTAPAFPGGGLVTGAWWWRSDYGDLRLTYTAYACMIYGTTMSCEYVAP